MEDYAIKLCNDLCEVVNNNPMPISMKYFIIKDFFNEAQNVYNKYSQQIQIKEKSESKEVTIPVEYESE